MADARGDGGNTEHDMSTITITLTQAQSDSYDSDDAREHNALWAEVAALVAAELAKGEKAVEVGHSDGFVIATVQDGRFMAIAPKW